MTPDVSYDEELEGKKRAKLMHGMGKQLNYYLVEAYARRPPGQAVFTGVFPFLPSFLSRIRFSFPQALGCSSKVCRLALFSDARRIIKVPC